MTAAPAVRRATYEDVLNAPPNMIAQVVFGVLHTHPRPAIPHANVSSNLGGVLSSPFRFGEGGPGGWVLLYEPELHLGGEPDILVPDFAGWRRERMPHVPRVAFIELAPDWVCEVLSPSTQKLDRADKMQVYLREQVRHVWLIDPLEQIVEVYRHGGDAWIRAAIHHGAGRVRIEPFDAVELDLAKFWAD